MSSQITGNTTSSRIPESAGPYGKAYHVEANGRGGENRNPPHGLPCDASSGFGLRFVLLSPQVQLFRRRKDSEGSGKITIYTIYPLIYIDRMSNTTWLCKQI